MYHAHSFQFIPFLFHHGDAIISFRRLEFQPSTGWWEPKSAGFPTILQELLEKAAAMCRTIWGFRELSAGPTSSTEILLQDLWCIFWRKGTWIHSMLVLIKVFHFMATGRSYGLSHNIFWNPVSNRNRNWSHMEPTWWWSDSQYYSLLVFKITFL